MEKKRKNPWTTTLKLEESLDDCLTKDFARLISAYVGSQDKSYEAFCELAKNYGITLVYNWCAPNTSKQPCHTTEYTDKVKYLILQAAKSFWICTNTGENCPHHPGDFETRFWRQVGGLFLVHLLHGSQPSLPGQEIKIDIGVYEIEPIQKFLNTVEKRLSTEDQMVDLYEGLIFIYTCLKVNGAFQPAILGSELGLSLLNFKK